MKRIKSVHPNPLVSDIGNQTLGPKGAIGRFDEWVRVHGSAELPNFRHLMQDGSCNTLQSILFVRKGSDKTEIPIQAPQRCLIRNRSGVYSSRS